MLCREDISAVLTLGPRYLPSVATVLYCQNCDAVHLLIVSTLQMRDGCWSRSTSKHPTQDLSFLNQLNTVKCPNEVLWCWQRSALLPFFNSSCTAVAEVHPPFQVHHYFLPLVRVEDEVVVLTPWHQVGHLDPVGHVVPTMNPVTVVLLVNFTMKFVVGGKVNRV